MKPYGTKRFFWFTSVASILAVAMLGSFLFALSLSSIDPSASKGYFWLIGYIGGAAAGFAAAVVWLLPVIMAILGMCNNYLENQLATSISKHQAANDVDMKNVHEYNE